MANASNADSEAGSDERQHERESKRSQLREHLEVQRMGVDHEEWDVAMLFPPRLIRACATAEGRVCAELVDRRAPHLPTSVPASAEEVLPHVVRIRAGDRRSSS